MKSLCFSLIVFCLAIAPCMGQEKEPTAAKATSNQEPLKGFAWLKQFEGTWVVVSKSVAAEGQPTSTQKALMRSRSIGNNWIMNEQSGDLGSMKFDAVQTIGYDRKTKRYRGRWIDSMLQHEWEYSGTLDETGNRIYLESEGPDWTDMSKTRRYRDVFEFKSADEIIAMSQMFNEADGKWETFINSTITRVHETKPIQTVTPFLMFEGKALEALELYKSVFSDLEVTSMEKYGPDDAGPEGTVKLATMVLEDQSVKLIDSPIKHDFEFTPSFSFFVECESEEQLKTRFEQLSKGGKVMMPIGSYGFSQKFAWVSDPFGVSWQLNLK